jgi:drug/metabolite transporter (DMT)-like permease
LLGAFYLSMVVVIWVGSAILIQLIFNSPDTQFDKPLFLTYFSTSFFTLYLIPLGIEFVYLRLKSAEQPEKL